ncbi:unnamed protein product [Lota lota]
MIGGTKAVRGGEAVRACLEAQDNGTLCPWLHYRLVFRLKQTANHIRGNLSSARSSSLLRFLEAINTLKRREAAHAAELGGWLTTAAGHTATALWAVEGLYLLIWWGLLMKAPDDTDQRPRLSHCINAAHGPYGAEGKAALFAIAPSQDSRVARAMMPAMMPASGGGGAWCGGAEGCKGRVITHNPLRLSPVTWAVCLSTVVVDSLSVHGDVGSLSVPGDGGSLSVPGDGGSLSVHGGGGQSVCPR